MIFGQNFWDSVETQVLLNPKLPKIESQLMTQLALEQKREASVWLKSSGTESGLKGHKLVCLAKAAILAGAKSFNDFFQVNASDRFLNSLPSFHIGGLSIFARASLIGAKVEVLTHWSPDDFLLELENKKITIASLVPTQVFDLVQQQKKAPKTLRFILVGGGALPGELYQAARELGWPLLPSYGMTETSAVMASATLESLKSLEFPRAEILPHISYQKMSNGRWAVESKSLFDGYLWVSEGKAQWEERSQPFVLDDRLEVDKPFVKVLGRHTELVKILGETVNLLDLQKRLELRLPMELAIVAIKEPRKGFDLHLFVAGKVDQRDLVKINQGLLPFERCTYLHRVETLPRNEMGKVDIAKLKSSLL